MAFRDRLQGFWREYRRDKIGLLGLGLLLVFVFIAVAFPLVGNMDVVRNWNNQEYFRFYPKTVPPCWASVFTGESYTKSVIAGGDAVKVIYGNGTDPRRGVRLVNATLVIPVNVGGSKPPSDVAVVVNMSYFSERYPFVVDKLVVERPDGSKIVLVPPGSGATVDAVLGGVPRTRANLTNFELSLRSIVSKPMLIQRFLLPELMRQGVPVSFGDVVTMQLNIFDALFSEDFVAALLGNVSETLRGKYLVVISIVGYGDETWIRIVPVKYVVKGSCFGLMGTDSVGRDLWQGLLYGVRWALIIGLMTSILSVLIGTLYGVVAGYFGGLVDEVMLRVAQIWYSLPVLPILILLAALYSPSIWLIIFALVVFTWPGTSFVTRAMALQIRQEPYVEAAIALGARTWRVLLLYVLPQVLPYMFASIALSVPGAIIAEASLSFLGVGDPSALTWGRILYEAQLNNAALNGYWWWVIPPGLGIALVGMTFIFIGSALDRILNPRLRR